MTNCRARILEPQRTTRKIDEIIGEARKYKTFNEFEEKSQTNFTIQRYRRALNNERRLSADDFDGEKRIIIWRTSDKPIDIGDYVYAGEEAAQHALSTGQGKKVYSKEIRTDELIQAGSPEGEFFYSPNTLKKYGSFQDFWKEANGIPVTKEVPITKTIGCGKKEV